MRDRRDIDPASSSSGFTRPVDTGLRDFMEATGRSDKNPFGDAGLFGSKADYSGIMTPQQIADVNRLAYEQAQGLISGRGYQGSGMDAPQVGYAPALKIGSRIPGGTVQLAPSSEPEPTSGLGAIGSFLKGGGIIGQLLGGGNRPRVFQPDEPPAQSLLEKANQKATEISNQPKINGGITGTRVDDTPTQVKPEYIPGMFQTVGLDALGSSQYLPPALQDVLMRAGRLAQDGQMPLQDLGIGNLFSQNMDPRQNFNVTV